MDCYAWTTAEARSQTSVDYDVVIPFKHRLLELAWNRFRAGAREDLRPSYEEFCHSRAGWLDDYALFRALKNKIQQCALSEMAEGSDSDGCHRRLHEPGKISPRRWIRSGSLSSCYSARGMA